ncbi:helix-turn-helix domain-containing protein [Mucilaginibacter robiniae]|uniref:Helix-turn-helix domain-containing protein n=1 Tax=Mucilaginibacter robiniae TaxID=2728022 RepID=A0A7L5DZV6_9SPHI|nr:helix-turn-helix domain-containing protein [Mucilaginibacter robiniae]QJD96642.1 helix-turn-helix domain-containing protein [Mucilaginibacter robiniae]
MEVICFEDRAFYALIDKLEAYIDSKKPKPTHGDKWVSGTEAMNILRIKSKTTLQKLRDEGKIRFTQPEKKIVLYDRDSIIAYLEDFTYETF